LRLPVSLRCSVRAQKVRAETRDSERGGGVHGGLDRAQPAYDRPARVLDDGEEWFGEVGQTGVVSEPDGEPCSREVRPLVGARVRQRGENVAELGSKAWAGELPPCALPGPIGQFDAIGPSQEFIDQ
jgi:hypothetical protein